MLRICPYRDKWNIKNMLGVLLFNTTHCTPQKRRVYVHSSFRIGRISWRRKLIGQIFILDMYAIDKEALGPFFLFYSRVNLEFERMNRSFP